MPFDFSTAKPESSESSESSGFDFASAKPVVDKAAPKEKFGLSPLGGGIVNNVTGMIAKPLSDIAGLAATGAEMFSNNKTDGDPAGFKRHVQDELTYQPRTPAGRAIAEYNPVALVGKGVGKVAEGAGNLIRSGTPGATRQIIGDATQEAINQAPGILGAKYGPSAAPKIGGGIREAGNAIKSAQTATAAKVQAARESVQNSAEVFLKNAVDSPAMQSAKSTYNTVKNAIAETPEAEFIKSKLEARSATQKAKAIKVQQALAEDSVRAQTIVESNKAGYKIPLSQLSKSKLASGAENIASDNIGRDFSLKNQKTTNRIIASEDLGLKPGEPITQANLNKAKEPHNATYQKIKDLQSPFSLDKKYLSDIDEIGGERTDAAKRFPTSLGNNDIESLRAELKRVKEMSPDDAMVLIKEYRDDATIALRSMDEPAKLEIGMAKRAAANAVEGMVERNLSGIDKNLYKEFVQARKSLAKINNADAALLDSSGDINAKLYAKLYEKGAPLDGGSLKVAKFASEFPQSARTPRDIGPNSKGSLSWWNVARPISRETIASKTIQDALVKKYKGNQP